MDKEFVGVFSRTDATGKKTYYFVWAAGSVYSIQMLNGQFQAVDMLKTVDAATLTTKFTHEPHIKKYPKTEAHRLLTTQSTRASTEDVESTLRELFRKALVRIKRTNSVETALPLFKNLLEIQEGITDKHKHMFNDFGIELRKRKCYPEAVAFAQRTLMLSPNDDHAHFNVARILIEMGDYDEAEQHILSAQYINPDSRIYKKTLQYIAVLRLQKEDLGTFQLSSLDNI